MRCAAAAHRQRETPTSTDSPRIDGIRSFTADAAESIDAALDRAAISAHLALPGGFCLKSVLAEIERDLVMQALTRSEGVVSRAARLLRLGRTTLPEKMRKLQLVRGEAAVEETQEA